ncbi:MAG: hypothetical protein NVS2B12_03660 [Ktedonobacteraceae bacterium]
MSTILPGTNTPIAAQPARNIAPRRLIVTAEVVAFALRDWSLWVLLRVGPWGPPMRVVLGNEVVGDAVERTLDALLLWAADASLFQLKAGWQEQQVQVWGSEEEGMAVSLIHSILLRANRDELRPNLHLQPVPSLHVEWVAMADIESGQRSMDPDVKPGVLLALQALRAHVQREPEIVLRYLADMGQMSSVNAVANEWWRKERDHTSHQRETQPLSVIKEPACGDGTLTLAEASLLYRALFPPDEQIDLSNLRRRFLATNRLEALDEDRPVRGREVEWRRVSRVYRYLD